MKPNNYNSPEKHEVNENSSRNSIDIHNKDNESYKHDSIRNGNDNNNIMMMLMKIDNAKNNNSDDSDIMRMRIKIITMR